MRHLDSRPVHQPFPADEQSARPDSTMPRGPPGHPYATTSIRVQDHSRVSAHDWGTTYRAGYA